MRRRKREKKGEGGKTGKGMEKRQERERRRIGPEEKFELRGKSLALLTAILYMNKVHMGLCTVHTMCTLYTAQLMCFMFNLSVVLLSYSFLGPTVSWV